ncbi:MAG: hypothetical protein ACK5YU_03665 [Burkholderiales bacterium]|jgi:hypothetical protein|nr:hypothetical protein [Betaproteobacteria bacterium]
MQQIKTAGCEVYETNTIVRLELSTFNAQVRVFSADNLWISFADVATAESFGVAAAHDFGVGRK